MKDAFDLWWEWAEKPFDSYQTVPVEIHKAVMAMSPEDRRDREKVNEAVRVALGPARETANPHRVPEAEE